MTTPQRFLGLGLTLAVALLLGITIAWFVPFKPGPAPAIHWLPTPRPLPEIVLHSADGRFDKTALRGRWTFLTVGYTHCPDICPLTLTQLAALAEQPALSAVDTAFVFVSVDPQRDTPARLHEYVRWFHPRLQGVTGDAEPLSRFTQALGIRFSVPNQPATTDYAVGHSSGVLLIGPDAQLHGRFSTSFDPGLVADAIRARTAARQ